MLSFRKISLILAGVLILSVSAEARVCFLAGSDDDEGCLTTPSFSGSKACPGYEICEIPEAGASKCPDGGINLYRPEDCCSDGSIYERCDGEGQVCNGASCTGTDAEGNPYTACEIGYCGCDASYTEDCTGNGLEGVGEPCGGLYQSCQCSSDYYACDADANKGGASCNDGTEKHTSCTCPTPDGGDWVTDPDECCYGFSRTCTNQPSGEVVYKCNQTPTYNCVCGFSYATGTSNSCINGCSDDRYEYVGNIPAHVICNDYVRGIQAACGNNCQCEDGYWDFFEECNAQKSTVCKDLGYTDKTCDGAWIACPYDVTAKKCLDTEGGDEELACTDGYAKTVADCGTTGSRGWTLGTAADNAGCYQCKAKTCPTGYTGGNFSYCLSGYKAEYHPTAYAGNTKCYRCVKDCPAGYSTSQFRICPSGQTLQEHATVKGCYGCVTLQCTDGYAKSAADCGTTGTKGWTLGTDTDAAGCKKCEKKKCSQNGFCMEGHLEPTDEYSGDTQCKICVNSCPAGYSENSMMMCKPNTSVKVTHPEQKNCYKCETCYSGDYYTCAKGEGLFYLTITDSNGNKHQCLICNDDAFMEK